jgi:hypothetical protein
MNGRPESPTPVRFGSDTVDRFDLPDRVFYLYAYFDGHRQLVLRAPRHISDEQLPLPTRVDVLFKDVHWVNLPTQMRGLTISTPEPGDLLDVEDRTTFVVRGSDYSGLVVAGAAYIGWDDVESLHAPSALSRDFQIKFVPPGPGPGDIAPR